MLLNVSIPQAYACWAFFFHVLTDTWESLPTPSCKRTAYACGVWNNQVILYGGRGPSGHLRTTVEIFDLVTRKWTIMTSVHNPRADGTSFVLDGNLYIGGGESLDQFEEREINGFTSSVIRWHPTECVWRLEPWRMPCAAYNYQVHPYSFWDEHNIDTFAATLRDAHPAFYGFPTPLFSTISAYVSCVNRLAVQRGTEIVTFDLDALTWE